MADCSVRSKSSFLGHTLYKANHTVVTSGDEYRAFVRKVEQLLAAVKRTKQDIDNSGEDAAKAYKEAVEDIRKYREDIDVYLDTMEHELLEKCYEINQENENALQKLDDEFKSMKYELDTVYSRLKSHGKQSGDMVLVANKTSSRLKSIVEALKADDGKTKIQLCTFKKSKTMRDMILNKRTIGKLEITLTDQPQQLDKKNIYDMVSNNKDEVKVNSKTDKKDCYITSIIDITGNMVACADWANNSVKLVDTSAGQVISDIQLTSQPWDITSVSGDQLAVTITSENRIQYLNINDQQLSKGQSIDVAGRCRGIAYNRENFIVSYDDPSKVEILNTYGKVLRCLKSDKMGNPLFERPYYVVVTENGDSVYVSDNEKHCVTRLTFDGQIIGVYKDTELRCPRGLVVCRDGSLLVCSSHGHSVHLISSECNRMKIMLRRKEGGEFCQAICYCDVSDILYLSNFTLSDRIRLYKFT